ncbi:unnamed protein product [Effrenium voratum]|uniref:Uncharacterized protein n=1 Tax=Effrenium voratum TaxID=2562239 RepID=A0AA36MIH6_9DINO|nr:unnamed protein product [Effrenium voratum]CAJ1372931.1 unnamed protein product [Effrenium voratum]CAJ1437196.1 unnamed protein product [Effrenium voratum]|mmetsp:Transcript_47233/g.112234  ORF Transcript_47233/g.112234 Transcript_47233/m.112234 type:complete len:338 (+) Transcript_47233:38-1051(+)
MACRHCLQKCAKRVARCFSSVEYTALAMCSVGVILVMSGTFAGRWRLDEHGTAPLENVWSVSGFPQKSYGLLLVTARTSQSWTMVTRVMCDWQGMKGAQISSWIQTGAKSATDGCSGNEDCGGGFAGHLYMRCKEYDRIYIANMAVMCVTFLTVVMCIVAILIGALRPLQKGGGVAYGLLLFSGFVLVGTDAAWAVTTWVAFKNLGETAWYPYPNLGIGWFLHIYGGLSILVASRIFGWLVMPLVRQYDPEQEGLAKSQQKIKQMKLWNKEWGQQSAPMGPAATSAYGYEQGYGYGEGYDGYGYNVSPEAYPANQDYQHANVVGAPAMPPLQMGPQV